MITNPSANIEPLVEYLKSVPFDVSRKTLYNAAEIYEGFNLEQPESFDNCFDTQVYRHNMSKGKITSDVKESVARMLHDHGMLIGIGEYFRIHNYLQFVGVMGGHALLRTDEMYRQIVFLSKRLTERNLQTVFVKMPFLHLPLVVLSIRRVVRELCKRFSRMLCRTTIYHLSSLVQ